MSANTSEAVRAVLEEILGVPRDSIAASAPLNELAPLDSLSLAELASALDRTFDIQLPGEDLTTSILVEELEAMVDQARGGARERT
jgi:acyl carrier protein